MCQDGERDRFFGIHIEAEFSRSSDPAIGQERRQLRHELTVMGPTSGRDQFLGSECESSYSCGNRGGGKRRGGRNQVFDRDVGRHQTVDKFRPILLPAGGLGRRGVEVIIAQQGIEKRPIDVSSRSDCAVAIESLPAGTHSLDQLIDHHIARPRIEGNHAIGHGCARQDGNVRDAADIQCHPINFRGFEKQKIDERNQRRALSPGGNVARTEIGNDRIPSRSAITDASPICRVFGVRPRPS